MRASQRALGVVLVSASLAVAAASRADEPTSSPAPEPPPPAPSARPLGSGTPFVFLPVVPPGASGPPAPPPPPPGYALEEPPPAQGPPPSWDYGPPPPVYVPPERMRGYHYRDGFYFRMAVGLARPSVALSYPLLFTTNGQPAGTGTDTLRGGGLGLDAAVGGNLVPGLALAVDFGGHDTGAPSSKGSDGLRVDAYAASRIGALVDFYPNPRRGLHVQAGAGLASATVVSRRSLVQPSAVSTMSEEQTFSGGQVNAGIGWEGWVGPDWSIGGLARIEWASMSATVDGGRAKLRSITPALMFSLTLN